MTNKTRKVEKFCKLRNMKVSIIEEIETELGNVNVQDWSEKKCLNIDEDVCLEKECSFTQLGGKYPF
jgi:hypothetical protein